MLSHKIQLAAASLWHPSEIGTGARIFNIFINSPENGMEGMICKFVHNTKLWGAVSMLEGRDAVLKDLDRLKQWADRELVRFGEGKCSVLQLGQNNPMQPYRLDNGSSVAEKHLKVPVDKKSWKGDSSVFRWQIKPTTYCTVIVRL